MIDFQAVSRGLYDIYAVKIRFRGRLCGGVAKQDEMLANSIKARTGYDDDTTKQQIAQAMAEKNELRVDDLVEGVAEKSSTGFMRDAHGIWIHARNIKAALKQGASMLRITMDKLGSKQIFAEGSEVKSVPQEFVLDWGDESKMEAGFKTPTGTVTVKTTGGRERIYVGRARPDGQEERPIHVKTPQGPRAAIKRVDYVENVELWFEIWVLGTAAAERRHIGQDDIVTVLAFDQENGVGADRSQGEGKFDVIEFEQIAQATAKPKKGSASKGDDAPS